MLRFELGSEEQVLASSYGMSLALASAFLALVHLSSPPVVTRPPVVDRPISFGVRTYPDEPTPPAPRSTARQPAGRGSASSVERPAFGEAPAQGGVTASIAEVLRSVAIEGAGLPVSDGSSRKVALGSDVPTSHPGRGGVADGVGGIGEGALGGVGGGNAIRATPVRVSPLPVVAAPLADASGRSTDDLGTVVRQHQLQLRECYVRSGLVVNPQLAGTVTLSLSIAPTGAVSTAKVARSTWAGQPGAADTESCLLAQIRRWRFAPAQHEGTFLFPINFTK